MLRRRARWRRGAGTAQPDTKLLQIVAIATRGISRKAGPCARSSSPMVDDLAGAGGGSSFSRKRKRAGMWHRAAAGLFICGSGFAEEFAQSRAAFGVSSQLADIASELRASFIHARSRRPRMLLFRPVQSPAPPCRLTAQAILTSKQESK